MSVEALLFGRWTLCATARIIESREPSNLGNSIASSSFSRSLSSEDFYAMWKGPDGIAYGASFRGIRELSLGDGAARARVELPDSVPFDAASLQHPALLDACLQVTAGALLSRTATLTDELIVPKSIAAYHCQGAPLRRCDVVAILRAGQADQDIVADITIWDEGGKLVGGFEGFTSVRGQRSPAQHLEYHLKWTPLETDRNGNGRAPILIGHGPLCSRLAEQWGAPPATSNDFRELTLPRRGARLAIVIDEASSFDDASARGKQVSLELLQLLQQLVGRTDECELAVVTNAAQHVSGLEQLNPAQAALWGIIRTFQAEHSGVKCRLVDVDATVDVERVTAELQSTSKEPAVALRGEERFALRLARGAAAKASTERLVRSAGRGYYLITGGLGHVGRVFAEHLTAEGDHAVLLNRRIDEHGSPGAIRVSTEVMSRIELAQGDVCDAEGLTRLLERCDIAYGPLKGVVHCAAVLRDAAIERMTEAEFAAAWSAKADGAIALRRALTGRAPDFVLLCSSMNAILASEGQANTAAANCFLDGFAVSWSKEGVPVKSVNWGAWGDSKSAEPALVRRLASVGIETFTDQEAREAFDRLLPQPGARACVMRFVPEKWVETHGDAEAALCSLLTEHSAAGARLEAELARLMEMSPRRREAAILADVSREIAGLLRLDPAQITADTTLESLGLTSLSALELRGALHRRFGVSLPATVVWRHPTLAALVATVFAALGGSDAPAQPQSGDSVASPPSVTSSLSEEEVVRLLEQEIAGV